MIIKLQKPDCRKKISRLFLYFRLPEFAVLKNSASKTFHYKASVTNSRRIRKIKKICTHHGIVFKIYDEKYERGASYRRDFLREHPQKHFYCQYCGRRIPREKMQIDHIIPVAQAQTNRKAQKMLKKLGCETVNDMKNLVPSCERCNKLKGEKLGGLWYIKGRLGGSRAFRAVRRILKLMTVIIFIILILWAFEKLKLLFCI